MRVLNDTPIGLIDEPTMNLVLDGRSQQSKIDNYETARRTDRTTPSRHLGRPYYDNEKYKTPRQYVLHRLGVDKFPALPSLCRRGRCALAGRRAAGGPRSRTRDGAVPVSYTHLTLPTICSV